MAFRVATTGTKRVVSKVKTSENTRVKRVTLGRPIHTLGAGGVNNQKLVTLLGMRTLLKLYSQYLKLG